MRSLRTLIFLNTGATYQNRRSISKHDRGAERYDRERLTVRDRETEHYDLNDEELLNEHFEVNRHREQQTREAREQQQQQQHGRGQSRGHSSQRIPSHRAYDDDYMHDPRERDPRDQRTLMTSRERDRYQQLPQHSSSRRDRDLDREYSPHRASGNNRRVLNAM